MRPEWSDLGFTVCYSNLVFLFDANILGGRFISLSVVVSLIFHQIYWKV